MLSMNRLEWDDQEIQDPDARGRRYRIQMPVMPQQISFHDLDIPTVLNSLPSREPVREPADGVLPPLLCTEQWRQMYLGIVQRLCQRLADAIVAEDNAELDIECNYQRDQRPTTIPRCDELSLFLKYAQAVVDIDFRLSGIAPFTPAWSAGVAVVELDGIDEEQRRDKLTDPELLKREQEGLQRVFEDELSNGWLEAYLDQDLEASADFITGVEFNQRYKCPAWYSAYVYYRLRTDNDEDDGKQEDGDVQAEDAANIRDWGWRVVFFPGPRLTILPFCTAGGRALILYLNSWIDTPAGWTI